MPNLSISMNPCPPGRPIGLKGAVPGISVCKTCGAPGGEHGELLEKHTIGREKSFLLCPFCHACLHLDIAGKMNAGRIIWLPELTQSELNILMLSAFVALRQSGVDRKNKDSILVVEQAKRLYSQLEKRSEIVEVALSSGETSLAARASLSTPTKVASLLARAKKDLRLTAKEAAQKMDGLRLLPNPKAFDAYITAVSKIVSANYPVKTWIQAAQDIVQSQSGGQQDGDGEFDADGVEFS